MLYDADRGEKIIWELHHEFRQRFHASSGSPDDNNIMACHVHSFKDSGLAVAGRPLHMAWTRGA
jgi:hypothetical protein